MKSTITLAFLLISLHSFAQPVLFSDEFDNNNNNWYTEDNNDVRVQVKRGVYEFAHKRTSSFWISTRNIVIAPNGDFTIDAAIRQTSGVDNYGYGLLFATADVNNYYTFQITTNGYFCIGHTTGGSYYNIKEWTTVSAIKGMNKWNKLKIAKKNQSWYFYVNDQEVYTCPAYAFKGNNVGFVVNNSMTIEIDLFEVRHKTEPIRLIPNYQTGYKKENLGSNVNTVYTEKSPVISSDGRTLYICRSDDPANLGLDDIWVATLREDGTTQAAYNIGKPLNNNGHNYVISTSPDNNTMLVGNTYNADGSAATSGFSITYQTGNGWTIPTEVKVKDFYNNAKYIETCLSSDRKTLLFTALRNETFGERDIYVCHLLDDDTWSSPVNIGNVVNTYADEASPFLAADGITMYYSTSGKPGYGSNDIFLTRRLDDTWLNWSEPENLGPEINTVDWDAYYTVPASGEYAYFASTRDAIGSLDIFRIKLPQSAKPRPVALVKGRTLNSKTKQPIAAQISYYDLKTRKEVGKARSNPSDGTYQVALPAGYWYAVSATREGFIAVSENLDLSDSMQTYREIQRDLYLSPIEIGQVTRLNNIFFDTDKSELKSESQLELDNLIRFLNNNPRMQIEISGHTDNVGADAYNLNLSSQRAQSVVQYLIRNDINASRLVAKGYGETKPISDNNTDYGRQQNRRVEFVILKN